MIKKIGKKTHHQR